MIKILFVDEDNTCLSPMIEGLMQSMIAGAGLESKLEAASAAAGAAAAGQPLHPQAESLLRQKGVARTHTSRVMCREDYEAYDLLVAVDRHSLYAMRRLMGHDDGGKMKELMDLVAQPGQALADPRTAGDADAAWQEIQAVCGKLLDTLAIKVNG